MTTRLKTNDEVAEELAHKQERWLSEYTSWEPVSESYLLRALPPEISNDQNQHCGKRDDGALRRIPVERTCSWVNQNRARHGLHLK